MRKLWIVSFLFCLFGCNHLNKMLDHKEKEKEVGILTARPIYLALGQSNMRNLFPHDIDIFQEEMGNNPVILNGSIGGSFLSEWEPEGMYFKAAVLYMQQWNQQYLDGQGYCAGILFYQGESDTIPADQEPFTQRHLCDYKETLTKCFQGYRQVLGKPDLPIVFCQIATTTKPERFKYYPEIKAQQRAVNMPKVRMVVTEDLPLEDYVHLSQAGRWTLSSRLAVAMKSL